MRGTSGPRCECRPAGYRRPRSVRAATGSDAVVDARPGDGLLAYRNAPEQASSTDTATCRRCLSPSGMDRAARKRHGSVTSDDGAPTPVNGKAARRVPRRGRGPAATARVARSGSAPRRSPTSPRMSASSRRQTRLRPSRGGVAGTGDGRGAVGATACADCRPVSGTGAPAVRYSQGARAAPPATPRCRDRRSGHSSPRSSA